MVTTIFTSVEGRMAEVVHNVEAEARFLMQFFHLSEEFGFLPEDPPRQLPYDTGIAERDAYFRQIDRTVYELPTLIRERRVGEAIRSLPIPQWYVHDLPRATQHRLHLLCAMLMHAYCRLAVETRTVTKLLEHEAAVVVPQQIAIPLFQLCTVTGINYSMAYELYSQWNCFRKDFTKPPALDNFDLMHTFTGSRDEKWFVGIHYVVDYLLAPVIAAGIKAYLLSLRPWSEFPASAMDSYFDAMREPCRLALNTLERMREHCDPRTYFRWVRGFYTLPKNILFEGVPELDGVVLSILGETGGGDQWPQFLHALCGVDLDGFNFHGIYYFPEMRKYMSFEFRELIERIQRGSRVREYVLHQLAEINNPACARRFNVPILFMLDWRREHYGDVRSFVEQDGEQHGTVKAPFPLLKDIYYETKKGLVDL